MRVYPVSNSYLNLGSKKSNLSCQAPVFKGVKGASAGAIGGLAYLGLMSVIAAPFVPLSLGFIALTSGVGAVAGHNFEKDFFDKKDDTKK